MVGVGLGFRILIAVPVHPFVPVLETVKVVLFIGETVIILLVELVLHVYEVEEPLAVSVIAEPGQNVVVLAVTNTSGLGSAFT